MGALIEAYCECGFEATVEVGGTMGSYLELAPFPHYCKLCGLVSVNTREEPLQCPGCGTTDVACYGRTPISEPGTSEVVMQDFDRTLTAEHHLCPECKLMTLKFSSPTVLFD